MEVDVMPASQFCRWERLMPPLSPSRVCLARHTDGTMLRGRNEVSSSRIYSMYFHSGSNDVSNDGWFTTFVPFERAPMLAVRYSDTHCE
eukprot:6190154-Pleurochrysis_carterae.AAC.3